MPATACIGCGLEVDSQGRLTVDTPPWPFRCQPGQGFAQPVACGPDGQLWAPPRQIVQTTLFSGSTPGMEYTAPGGGASAEGFSRTFSLTLDNPDPCRRLHGVLLLEIDYRFRLPSRAQIQLIALGNVAATVRNDDSITHDMSHEITRNLSVSIPPGGTQTLSWVVATNMQQNSGLVLSISNVARLLAVSSQPV